MDPSLRQSDVPVAGVLGDGDRAIEEEPPPRWRLQFELVEDDGDWQAFGDFDDLVAAVQRVLANARELPTAGPATAAIALSSDAEVRRLNATYRGKDTPTNVLSFPASGAAALGADADSPRALGDIVLAVETVLAEAAAAGISPAHHFQHLMIHGVLHLIGYDHLTDADAETMEALETTLLARLGIADPYADRADTPDRSVG
ncbi:MAG: rRNA maturation RNase YbeY [Hyphomicrobiaceae bacterium]